MKFIVSSSALLKQLQQISGVISANTVLPILEDFLFEVEKNRLTIVATDLETVMKVHLDVEARDTGKVCIPAKILLDSLKNIADQPLAFTIDKQFSVEITSDNGKYKVMGENPDNFPKDPSADETTSFEIPASVLVTAINKSLFAVSNDDLRPAMTGVLFEMSPGSHSVCCNRCASADPVQTIGYFLCQNRIPDRAEKAAEFIKVGPSFFR